MRLLIFMFMEIKMEKEELHFINGIKEEDLLKILDLITKSIGINKTEDGHHFEVATFFFIRQILIECPGMIKSILSSIFGVSKPLSDFLLKNEFFVNEDPIDNIDFISSYISNYADTYRKTLQEERYRKYH
jgi:hypothetical protein